MKSGANVHPPGKGAAVKYAVFWTSLAGVPFLAWFMSLKLKWIRWAIFGMIVGIYAYQPTAINFLSHEWYTGTARGMEISLIHLLALAALLALVLRGKWNPLFPETGIRIYAVYFFLCLPSLWNADDPLVGWLEIWKMMLLFLFWHAMYAYLRATDDVGGVVAALAVFTLADFAAVLRQHYGGWFQVTGVFPLWNSLGAAMNLLGPVFLSGYLQMGLRRGMGWLCATAAVGAAISTVWSYSRASIAVMPVAYGLAALGCLVGLPRKGRVLWRLSPVLLAGLIGLCAAWPHIVDGLLCVGNDQRTSPCRCGNQQCHLEHATRPPIPRSGGGQDGPGTTDRRYRGDAVSSGGGGMRDSRRRRSDGLVWMACCGQPEGDLGAAGDGMGFCRGRSGRGDCRQHPAGYSGLDPPAADEPVPAGVLLRDGGVPV